MADRRTVDLTTAREREMRPKMLFSAMLARLKEWDEGRRAREAANLVDWSDRNEDSFAQSFDAWREGRS